MRRAFKRSTALKRCTRAHSEVCTRTLHDPRAFCRLRRTNSNAAACSLSTPRGAGLSPCTERHSAGHTKQRAAGPRWPEEPLAQLSWASPRTAGAVASRHLRPGMSVGRPSLSVKMLPHVCRAAARRFSTSGFSAERVGPPHACGRRCLCGMRLLAVHGCADRSGLEACRSRAVTRLSTGSPRSSPGSLPALLDLGALLHLRQHTSTGARSQPAHGGSEKDAIGDWEQRNDPSPGPGP